jgi:hypothetical protein
MSSLPSTIAGIAIPSSPTITAALAHINAKNLPSTVNHCIRSSIFAVLITSKHPGLVSATISPESLVLACLLHDLGWSTSPECVSPDKRFEVDGANAAREYLASTTGPKEDDEHSGKAHDVKAIWYAIALHSTPSIALHSEPLVAATAWGIMADFLGPETPGGFVTEGEFREVLKAYPRAGLKEDTFGILCGLCKNKPETTFDNFVGDIGRKFVEAYEEKWEERRFGKVVWAALERNEVYET